MRRWRVVDCEVVRGAMYAVDFSRRVVVHGLLGEEGEGLVNVAFWCGWSATCVV
jgi:hypothetical protein